MHKTKELSSQNTINLSPIDFVSHELKTPLSTLKLNIEILKKQAHPEQKKWLNIMETETNWMIQFISDTLDLSQFRQKALFRPRRLNWEKWIFNLKISFEKQEYFWSPQIKWFQKPSFKPRASAIEVLIDPLYMRQALLNLIINAVTHSPENSLVEIFWHTASKNNLKVCVADQGEGIKNPHKIFEPFQTDHVRPSKGGIKGSGLGLTISKQIITAHGGLMYAQNRPEGKGVIFTFTLPFCL